MQLGVSWDYHLQDIHDCFGRFGRHFGEAPAACSSMCDVCSAKASGQIVERRDISAAAMAVVRTLAEWPSAEKRATLIQVSTCQYHLLPSLKKLR